MDTRPEVAPVTRFARPFFAPATRITRPSATPGHPPLLPAIVCALVLAVAAPAPAGAQDNGYTNLQVLPADISRRALIDVMLDNLAHLGLPRRANEGCLFCHAGSMDVPSAEWDWASDENPMKDRARVMMRMVRDINGEHLAGLPGGSETAVTCGTCHAARTDPAPLPAVLMRAREAGGVDRLVETYRDLRGRYYASDAYDFRTHVLADVARELAGEGAVDDAVRVHELNIEYSSDPAAHHGLIHLRLERALAAGGVEAMLARYEELKDEHPTEAFTPGLLGALGWGLFRSDREDAGFALFELNFAEHPDAYGPTEDLAWGNESMGNHERAIELARAWVERHPDHELGRRLLADLGGAGAGP